MDGESLLINAHLPNDTTREFILATKHIYSLEKFKEIMTSNGVLFNPVGNGVNYLMTYFYKWNQYLINTQSAEIMRSQMGWTDKETRDTFVLGKMELKKDGTVASCAPSPLSREVSKTLSQHGSYEQWKASVNKLSNESMEIHAFILLCGFGSILMNYTSTPGVTVALTGKSGFAKTGAMYAALSIWGDPEAMSIATAEGATANGLVGRYLTLHNLPYGIDEIGNIDPKTLSALILKISNGKAKIKMQGSVNAEREIEASASLIAIMTANGELYDKLKSLKANPEGEVARLIEIKAHSVPKYLAENTSEGPKIFNSFRSHYGWAGPDFVKATMEYSEDEIIAKLDEVIAKFKKDFGDFTPYRYYENLMAVTMVAGQLLAAHDILHLPLERIYNVMLGQLITIRDDVVKISEVDYESILATFVNNHQSNILSIKEDRVTMEPKGALLIRADVDKSKLYINQPAFNKYLGEVQISTREFLHNMNLIGIPTINNKKTRMGAGWKDATAVFNDNAYVFDSLELLSRIISEPDE
jgi:hypothetical protein